MQLNPNQQQCAQAIENQWVAPANSFEPQSDDPHLKPLSHTARTTRYSETKLNIAVVGAGPGGMVMSEKLHRHGNKVTLIEKEMPFGPNRKQDYRSFNLTIDGLGMHAVSTKIQRLIYSTGRFINGRVLHLCDGSQLTYPYGHSTEDHFIAVSRSDLLCTIGSHLDDACPNCEVHYNSEVIDADVDEGVLTWQSGDSNSSLQTEKFDLVIFCDGVRGYGRSFAAKSPGISIMKHVDKITYLKAEITPDCAHRCQLPLDKINFWPGRGGVSIGVPNIDGSVSVLIMGDLPGVFSSPVFSSETDVIRFLQERNPELIPAIADMSQLVDRRRGHFLTTETSDWRLGNRAVLLGDAGRCAPPWAGLGANSALSDCQVLEESLSKHDNLEDALAHYNDDRIVASSIIQELVSKHGKLLNVSLGSRAWRTQQLFLEIRERITQSRTMYQQIAFDKGGLNRLIEARLQDRRISKRA